MLDEKELYGELARRAELADVGPDTELAGLDLDSVQWLDLIGWLAERGVVGTPATFTAANTAGDLHALLHDAGPAPDAADPGSASPLLTTPTYRLQPIDPPSMGFLYSLAVSSEVGYRWRFRGSVPNYETFEASFWQGTLCQFVAYDRASDQPCGHLVCYNPEMTHGYATVAAVFTPGHVGTGGPLQCVGAFVSYIFTVWPMRKLYLEVPSFNVGQFAAGAGRLFSDEGRLVEHDYYAGRYWDRHILAVYRRHVGLAPIAAL
jgi:RimJ/RimL family protein N-acetyltransferase